MLPVVAHDVFPYLFIQVLLGIFIGVGFVSKFLEQKGLKVTVDDHPPREAEALYHFSC